MTRQARHEVEFLPAKVSGLVGGVSSVGASMALFLVTVSVVVTVIARYWDIQANWSYTLNSFTAVWLTMLGAAYTAFRRAHVNAGVSLEKFTRGRLATAIRVVRTTLCAAYLLLLVWTGAKQTMDSFAQHTVSGDLQRWPVWIDRKSVV